MTKSRAAMEATRRYESNNYDNVRVLLPKGTKDRIKATGATVNGFINRCVLSQLDSIEQSQGRKTSDLPAE